MPIFGEPVPSSGNPAGTSDPGTTGAPSAPVSTPPASEAPSQGAPAATTAPGVERQYVDTNSLGSHFVKVKVDGQDMELPLNDALNGVMMQQAFTRRTQELAEERKRFGQARDLVEALESNPRATLQQLAQVYEIGPDSFDAEKNSDPTEQRFAAMENQLRQQNAYNARMQVQGELQQLENQFGQFDKDAVIDHAMRNRMPVTLAYKDLHYDRLMLEQQRSQMNQQNRNNAIGAQVVEGGAGTQAGAVAPANAQINSVHDAWKAAKQQHGIS